MKSLTIYISKNDDGWLRELRKYAKDNHWSISLAVRELLSKYFEVKPEPIPVESTADISTKGKFIFGEKSKEPEKVDPDTYFAQIESKLAKAETSDIDKQMAECIKEKTNSKGEVSCYFFDNAMEHFSFCKQYCWTNKKIWGKRVRL